VKPVLFVTGQAPPDRVEPFRLLAEAEDVHFALFGGRTRHATEAAAQLPFPHSHPSQREVYELAASGDYRAVVCGTVGRVALPAAYGGARRAGVPFLLWSALWSHPRTPAGLAGWPLMRHVYRHADAVITYGPHVSAYAGRHGAENLHEAPQAVDNEWWRAEVEAPKDTQFTGMFVGRLVREKGVRVLSRAWRASGLQAPETALVLVGGGPVRARAAAPSAVRYVGARTPEEVRNFYAGADVLLVPSIATASFREPWGLVVNEAMNQGLPIIASDAVGAVAGGLVQHERNGLVVPAANVTALAAAIRRLFEDVQLRTRLGATGREDVRGYTFEAWVQGVRRAFASTAVAKEA
jgi:glycosyltransferase involved in cell wall biosynthesis